ncbi:MAG: DNA translocase FtsK 4TM domain-containing protein [Clostridia bacterium]|nr:DNA translocase FtsK 4TM domain-containing protein [Clostridia bacterium]
MSTPSKKKPVSKKKASPSGKQLSGRSTQPRETKQTKAKYPKKELRLIGLVAASIILVLSFYIDVITRSGENAFGPLGKIIKNTGCVMLGTVGYAIPLFVIIATIHLFVKGTLSPHKHRYVFSAIGLICISGLHSLYYAIKFPELHAPDKGFSALIGTIADSGKYCDGGGIIGALLSLPLKALVSSTGTAVILVFLALIAFVAATGTEPITRFASWISRKISGFVRSLKEERKPKEQEGEQLKINGIDDEKTEKKEKKKIRIVKEKEKEEPLENEDQKAPDNEDDIKINVYTKDKTASAEIPEDVEKMAMEESGGVKEEKVDNTPIEVTEEEIESDYINYTFPPIDLLSKNKSPEGANGKPEDLRLQAKKLVDTLQSFGVEAKVLEVSRGPSVTRFELQPSAGVKVSKIVNLADDIALNLAAFGVRIEAPIPGKAAVGIEIPNQTTSMVCLRDVIDSNEFRNYGSKTAFAMGKDISGNPIVSDISKMPHMLIAGATGSGKSVCINSLITSILYKADPNQVKLILIDPKVVELGVYNGIPHLLIPVVTDPRRAAGALNWAVQEMVKRYRLFADTNVRDIKGYNEYASLNGEREMEQIVIIIDELADLMMVSPHDVEDSICRLAQMARAAGMHLVIATQRPSVDVITGLIKANVPSRIAFSVSSQIDSRTILDMGGAEKLLGKGDMLFLPMGASKPKRIQGAFVSDKEVEKIVEFVKADSTARYNEDIIEHIENGTEGEKESDNSDCDELLPEAMEIVVELGQASASLLQRKLKVGYSRAGRLIDQLEERGVIGPHEGSKPRRVLMSRAEYQEMMLSNVEEE